MLGPYADWMDLNKSYRLPGDIGGPMNLGEGYRWNVPVITYGFERSFLDYFGTNGVAAVESAIQTLNQVPSASQINLQDFPLETWRANYQAQALGLLDLKSTALTLLLEQLGLTDPERQVFVIRDFVPLGTNYGFYVVRRNFDSATAQPSSYVNGTLFTYSIENYAPFPTGTNAFCDAIELPVDPQAPSGTTATARYPGQGAYITRLTRDDVGGLKYLLDGNQIRYESLLADVHSATTNTPLIRSAWRPGFGKITLVRHPAGALSGEFRPFTNQWTDVYYSGDDPAYQAVERITVQPDIVFTARDLGTSTLVTRTGTTNWVNNAELNGNAGGPGPGVIQPGIVLAFNNAGPTYENQSPGFLDEATGLRYLAWGSFDGSTNPPVVYPVEFSPFQPTQIRFQLVVGGRTNHFLSSLPGAAQARFFFQTATNFTSWTTLATVTNSGTSFTYTFLALTNEPCRYFRTVPEP